MRQYQFQQLIFDDHFSYSVYIFHIEYCTKIVNYSIFFGIFRNLFNRFYYSFPRSFHYIVQICPQNSRLLKRGVGLNCGEDFALCWMRRIMYPLSTKKKKQNFNNQYANDSPNTPKLQGRCQAWWFTESL